MSSRKIVSFDWAIKNVLRDKGNFVILEGFLNALLRTNIKIESLIDTESNIDREDMKYNRVDILAVNDRDEHIIIELQYAPEQYFFQRILFGTCQDIINNIKSGEDYSHVKKLYSIGLVYFDVEDLSKGEKRSDYVYHGKTEFYGLHSKKRINLDSKHLAGYDTADKHDMNIFPEYYLIPIDGFNDHISDELDEWIYAIKNNEIKDTFKAPGIKEMGEKLDFISMNSNEQRTYKKYLEELASVHGVHELSRRRLKEKEDIIKQKDQVIEQNVKDLEQKDQALEQKDQALEQNVKALEVAINVIMKNMSLSREDAIKMMGLDI